MKLETPSSETQGKNLPENPATEACGRIADRTERVFDVPKSDGEVRAETLPTEREVSEIRENADHPKRENSLDGAMRRPLRNFGSRISNLPGIRNLSENAMNRIGTAGILGTFCSAPLLNMGANWIFHNVAKPLASLDYFTYSASSEFVGWALFGTCMAISTTNLLISRGRVFNVGEYSKICISNDPKIAELHVQRNLKTIKDVPETERIGRFFEDVATSLSELQSARTEKFAEIREVRMHSWILSRKRIRNAFVESLRERGFEAEDRGTAKGSIGFGKKFALSALFSLAGEWKKSMKRFISKDTEEGMVVVKLKRKSGGA